MKKEVIDQMVKGYEELKNLKLVGESLGIPWQTVYWWLKKEGVQVIGDKERYGGKSDQVALIGENFFRKSFPDAIDHNAFKFQAKIDFTVGDYTVDVKTSFLKDSKSRGKKVIWRWSFNNNSQADFADFLVCYCLKGVMEQHSIAKILLIPREFIQDRQTISVSSNYSKWYDFEVTEQELVSALNLGKE